MTGADWLLLVAIGALFLVSGVLAMAETAFTRMSRVRALALEEEGRSGATRLARLLERPERTLNSLLLVIPTPGSVVRNMAVDSSRARLWLALSGTQRLGRIDLK